MTRTRSFFVSHLQVLFFTLGKLCRTPFNTLLTSAAIGIALALPAGLHYLVEQTRNLGDELDAVNQVSVFLHRNINSEQLPELKQAILAYPEVADVRIVLREQALLEFQQYSGFGDALKALSDNPLPHLLIVYPGLDYKNTDQIGRLVDKLDKLRETDIVQLDIQWLQRLYAMVHVIQRGVLIIAALLGIAVLLIIGNTIRLAIENRRSEIVVMKLIGATNGFIRRPFLYTGLWYGLGGSVLAIVLVNIAFIMIKAPLTHLSALYHTNLFSLGFMGIETSFMVILSGCMLGYAGAWLAVGRHLHEIEPK